MLRVEWVTDQVRWRKGRDGGWKGVDWEEVAVGEEVVYLKGRRIVMVVGGEDAMLALAVGLNGCCFVVVVLICIVLCDAFWVEASGLGWCHGLDFKIEASSGL